MKRILVTGGCGFVGSNLVPLLLSSGLYRVRVLDNESVGRFADLIEFASRVEFEPGDLRDAAALAKALVGVDAVVHLAADTSVTDSVQQPWRNFENNVLGSLQLLEAMRRAGVRRLINASSGGAILGEAPPPVHERMPAAPLSPYGASKLAVEGYCSAYQSSFGFETVSLRFANVYGPGCRRSAGVIALFFRALLAGSPICVHGDGSQIRDFVFVEDICRGILAALRGPASGVFQLGSGAPTSLRELLEQMSLAAGRPFEVRSAEARPGEVFSSFCDVTLAREQLGWVPETTLAVGLRKTWAWLAAGHAESLHESS
jgi:UDP-glucose 4-epimerase